MGVNWPQKGAEDVSLITLTEYANFAHMVHILKLHSEKLAFQCATLLSWE